MAASPNHPVGANQSASSRQMIALELLLVAPVSASATQNTEARMDENIRELDDS